MISKDSKTFCILPFVHTHLNTEGDVYPCCVGWNASRSSRVGFLKDNTLEEIFNSDEMKQLRLDLVNGVKRPEFCDVCYRHEDNGFHSARKGNNNDFLDVEDEIVASMHSDGYLEPLIKSWDIRFSNLCNLKCRTCGDIYSTSWAQETEKFLGKSDCLNLKSIPEGSPDPLENQYDVVEKIYFAGGEPLIMSEHFKTLQKLIDSGRSKHVKLVYNTNMTKLNYNRNNLVEYWKKFKQVVLGMSIDAYGDRAEYIRNGVKWNTIAKNIKEISEISENNSNINYHFSVTVSLLNVYTITDLHRYLYENGYTRTVDNILLNVLFGPSYYELRNLPIELKEKTKEKIKNHMDWMKSINPENTHALSCFNNMVGYLDGEQNKADIASFVAVTKDIDKRRNQSFPQTFPEYKEWWEKINNNIIDVKNI